jgi:hypothetical protein
MPLPVADTLAGLSPPSDLKPALKSEINTLSTVEAQIEAGMVTPGESDDEFTSLLYEVVWSA